MGIERQVIGDQVDVMLEQARKALLHPPRHAAILPAPEQTVVDQDRISLGFDRRLDQVQARGHAADNMPDLLAPLDLQAVRPIILETRGFKRLVEMADKVGAMGHGVWVCANSG